MTGLFGLFRPRRWADLHGTARAGDHAPSAAENVAVVGDAETAVVWRRVDGRTDDLGQSPTGGWLVVALHGLGADEHQISTLVPLRVPGVVVAPRAPHRHGRDGWSWTDPPLATDPASLVPAADLVASFTTWAGRRAQIGPDRTVLVGYSQGAAVAAAVGLRHPGVAASIALTTAAVPRGMCGLGTGSPRRAYVAVGLRDRLVDDVALAELRCHWREGGTMLRSVEHDLPHVVSPAVAAEVSRWIVEEPAG